MTMKARHAWYNARQRCIDPEHPKWPRYGARGIRMCDRWLKSFDAFLADMGAPPPGTSLERENNDGHYEPGNCIWASPKTQANNRSTTLRLTAFGRTQSLQQWAEEAGVSNATMRTRLFRCGWTLEQAVAGGK